MSSPLQNNIANLQSLLDKVNALPEAGTDLPELANEGTADDLVFGKELIDSSGNIVTGTNTYEKAATDTEVATQTDLLEQAVAALEGKTGTLKEKSGSFTTGSNGYASVNCGFRPDLVKITFPSGNQGTAHFETDDEYWLVVPDYTDYLVISSGLMWTSTGFVMNYAQSMNWDISYSAYQGKICTYTAIKYT